MNKNSLSVLTYNVAFHLPQENKRTDALLDLITELSPTVICLQEIPQSMFSSLQNSLKNTYVFNRDHLPYKYGTAIFLHNTFTLFESQIIPYDSFQSRELNWITTSINGKDLSIATTHLESEFPHQHFKYPQFKQMFVELDDHPNSIICGDMNIIESDESMFTLTNGWEDIWVLDGRKPEKQYTLDIEGNAFVDGPYQTRLDRIYTNSSILKVAELQLVKGEYEQKAWISDHFGYFVKFVL